MAFTNKFTKETLILFLFLAFLPFGQILRLPIHLLGTNFYLNVSDAVALSSLILALFSKIKYPFFWKSVKDLLIVLGFSLFFSISFFPLSYLVLGIYYLLRVVSYFYFFLVLWNYFKGQEALKQRIFRGLILTFTFVALFGWVQYLMYPDLRALKFWEWDDHFLRMVGGFLDPTFTGLFLVFANIINFFYYVKNKDKRLLGINLFLIVSLAFTYSRASFLAFVVAFVGIAFYLRKVKEMVLLMCFFMLVVFLLPGGASEGVNLGRLNSVTAKAENLKESIVLAKTSPIFGLGFNNLCVAKVAYLKEHNLNSHACSGLDSSLLFLLVTTGISGVFSFVNMVSTISKGLKKNIYSQALLFCSLALFVHSLFANSLFYSWVMGFMAILLALSI